MRLISPESETFVQDKHADLRPSYADPESLEVDYLKIETVLEAGQHTYAVAFACGTSAEGIQSRREEGKLIVQRGDVLLAF